MEAMRQWLTLPVIVASELLLALGWLLGAMRLEPAEPASCVLWMFPLTGAVVVALAIMVQGARATLLATMASLFVIGSVWQVHAGFRMTYLDGDTATDTMIYNTTSPDVKQFAEDLGLVAQLSGAGTTLPVLVEACESIDWVMRWYLRSWPNVRYVASLPEDPSAMAPVMIGSLPGWSGGDCAAPESIPGYSTQQIVFRWHEPESAVYRRFAIAPELEPFLSAWQHEDNPHGPVAILRSVIDSLVFGLTPQGQGRLIDLLLYRESGAPLNPFYANVYIRNDLLPYYNDARYGAGGGMRNNP
jgi:hypothetical protein